MYVKPTAASRALFISRGLTGPVDMLNLLRFREEADYSHHPELAPPSPVSGREAYKLYLEHSVRYVREVGGELLYAGAGGPPLIGPEEDGWDQMLLLRYPSVEAFFAFASDPGYLSGFGHRIAALRDSRIVPFQRGLPV